MASDDDRTRKTATEGMRAAAVAWTLPFSLVVPMVIGGGAGYLLDRWLHTKPAFMIILGLVGVALGIWDVVKTASLLDKK